MMTVEDIIKAVRWCIDEEAVNAANIDDASAYDLDGGTHTDERLMNNIIRNKIPDALRWVCLYAPAEQLSGGSSSSDENEEEPDSVDIIVEEELKANAAHTLKPTSTLVRVVRVKGTGWHRAILGDSLIKEDSDEYLQLNDPNGATATTDRPQAALVNTKSKAVEVWPSVENEEFLLTYITALSASSISNLDDDKKVGVPANVETSFIYYLAYLLLTAYGDARAKSMFEVATLHLGKTDDKQRA